MPEDNTLPNLRFAPTWLLNISMDLKRIARDEGLPTLADHAVTIDDVLNRCNIVPKEG